MELEVVGLPAPGEAVVREPGGFLPVATTFLKQIVARTLERRCPTENV